MPQPPWEREWLRVTPAQFEQMIVEFLRKLGKPLLSFAVDHQVTVRGPDGEFAMDAVAKFEALGADFIVLVECKHHKNPIKRELVQVLADKIRSVRAHKGMLFSTASFQQGAIEYATAQRITLVHFTEGGPLYETRASVGFEGPKRPFDAYWVMLNEAGTHRYRRGGFEELGLSLFNGEDIDTQ